MHDDFTVLLDVGTEIRLQAIEQSRVYAGLLEGLPTIESNQRTVRHDVHDARRRWNAPVHLITPTEELIEWTRPDPYPFGTPSQLPPIGVRALFDSFTPVDPRHETAVWKSWLTILWYQEEWALPIDNGILGSIRAIPWQQLAHDHEV